LRFGGFVVGRYSEGGSNMLCLNRKRNNKTRNNRSLVFMLMTKFGKFRKENMTGT